MTDQWRLCFYPGIWDGDDLTRPAPQGEDTWDIDTPKAAEAVDIALDGGHWDEQWEMRDFPAAPAWTHEWAGTVDGNRQYEFRLVSPAGDRYSEDDIRGGELLRAARYHGFDLPGQRG